MFRKVSATAAAVLFALWSSSSMAAYLVVEGTIVKLANTSSNATQFAISVTGGTNNLCQNSWILFRQSDAPDPDTFKRAYAAALTAYATGARVSVYNYTDNDCYKASYIELGLP